MVFDVLVKNGKVVDGCGNPWFRADVGIKDSKVTALGKLEDIQAGQVIDAKGKIVSPGFIDLHSHSDFVLPLKNNAEIFEPFIRQGITTLVTGNCGFSPAPLVRKNLPLLKLYCSWACGDELEWSWESMGDFLDYLEGNGVALNVAHLVAQGGVRIAAMGFEARPANESEMGLMKRLVEESLQGGAFGLSTGLMYAPGMFTKPEEIVELAKILPQYNAVYTTHQRGLSETLIESTNELIETAQKAGCPSHISHLISAGKNNWPLIGQALDLVEKAREQGLDITFDTLPYTGGNTTALAICPPWTLEKGVDGLMQYLQDPSMRAKIEKDINETIPTWPHWETGYWSDNAVRSVGWDRLSPISIPSQKNKHLEGLSFQEIAEQQGKTPFDAYADLVVEEQGDVMILILGISGDDQNEEWLTRVLLHPLCSIMTDALLTGRGKPIPAAYGSFPRMLGRYARELGLIRLEEAIRKMTSLSAQRFGIKDRGMIREGNWADITIFDPDTIIDKATFEDPFHYPEGISHVLINGQVVLENGEYRSELHPGRVLRRSS